MLIGSNNSLTYLEPSSWWLKLFKRIGRTQEVPYDEQYTFWGVRYFDFKLGVNKHNHIMAKNGRHIYPLFSFYEILDYANKMGDIVVNIVFDVSFDEHMSPDYLGKEKKFIEICNIINTIYKGIHFVGGKRRFDDKVLYKFDSENSKCITDIIRPSDWSPVYRFVSKWLPFLIGGLNSKYLKKFKDKHVFLVLDYVNRR